MTSWVRRLAFGIVAALATGAVVIAGVWVSGGVLTDDAMAAKALTGTWFVVSGAAAALLVRAHGARAAGILIGWAVAAVASGGLLLVTSTTDRVVDEAVVSVATGPSGSPPNARSADATLEAAGRFLSGAHETRGTATVLRTGSGRRVLTLTGFDTAPGPDLRVYVVAPGTDVDDAVDLGRLKGNKGDQQYVVPPAARVGSVVIWCRAFSVSFGSAVLQRRV